MNLLIRKARVNRLLCSKLKSFSGVYQPVPRCTTQCLALPGYKNQTTVCTTSPSADSFTYRENTIALLFLLSINHPTRETNRYTAHCSISRACRRGRERGGVFLMWLYMIDLRVSGVGMISVWGPGYLALPCISEGRPSASCDMIPLIPKYLCNTTRTSHSLGIYSSCQCDTCRTWVTVVHLVIEDIFYMYAKQLWYVCAV